MVDHGLSLTPFHLCPLLWVSEHTETSCISLSIGALCPVLRRLFLIGTRAVRLSPRPLYPIGAWFLVKMVMLIPPAIAARPLAPVFTMLSNPAKPFSVSALTERAISELAASLAKAGGDALAASSKKHVDIIKS